MGETMTALETLDELLFEFGEVEISYSLTEELYTVTLSDGKHYTMPGLKEAVAKAFGEGAEK